MNDHLQPRSVEDLWQDYWFLTREMSKFLARQEMDLFYDLMAQREQFQAMLEESGDRSVGQSPEGRAFLEKIQQENRSMQFLLRAALNKRQQQRAVSNAYSGEIQSSAAGRRFNREG
ncbi:hypothetical protein [Acetonema longum]|uniref:Flagellar protein FliT n=1 Tax=Acetonema longum DSM 6540 TaxID=1009370 RepID=F7NNW7_9FIRM|nr:hypothetical protein [Acetonema longum]EGO62301.1 hypothetical protein ALO_19042 [Acetonema longum DSM 6540]